MKVVQLITHMNEIGGAQVHVRDLSKKLVRDDHSVTILSGGLTSIPEALLVKNVTYKQSKFLARNIHIMKDLFAFFEIRKKLKELQPDIVAIHSSKAGIIGRIACWSLHIPSVFTAHGWAFTEGVDRKKQFIYQKVEKWVGKFSKKVITVCDYDRNLALRHQILPPHKVITIHNGVTDTKERVKEINNNEVKIAMVARFEKPKQQLELLKALQPIKDLKWHLLLVGDGSLKESSQLFVQEYRLMDKVTFFSSKENSTQILSNADIFVLTSQWEGFPLSILEAMTQSLPIIASNVGGVKEAIRDGENGFLINHNLTELLQKLIEDEQLRKKMGEKSREIYEACFTFEKMYEKTLSTYRNLIIMEGNR